MGQAMQGMQGQSNSITCITHLDATCLHTFIGVQKMYACMGVYMAFEVDRLMCKTVESGVL